MKRHIVMMHDKTKDFKCTLCTKEFSTNGQLTSHVQSFHHHVKKSYCNMCDKMFANNAAVKQHMQEVRSTVFNLRKFSLIHFDKNFVKATQLKEKSLESWFDDIFFFSMMREKFSSFASHSFTEKKSVKSTPSKNVAFTKFLSKMCERISETTLCIITDFFREIEIFTQLFLDHFRLLIFSDLSSCEIVSCELWISKNARKVTRYLLEIDTAKCSKQLIFDMIRVLILIHPKLVSRKNRQNDNKASATL